MIDAAFASAKRVLAVRLDNIGDVLMLGPALRAIKEQNPVVHLTLLASPGGASGASLLPWVDEVVTWRAVWQDISSTVPLDAEREGELVALLQAGQFDAALVFTSFSQTPHVPAYVCGLAGIPLRVGESKEFGGGVLTHELRGAPDDLHQVERNLRLIEALGVHVSDRSLGVLLDGDDDARAARALYAAGVDVEEPYILIHPGASAAARRYPAEKFGVVARLCAEQGWPVVVSGTAKEKALIDAVLTHAPEARVLDDALDLRAYGAVIANAALVVCNNTLPMHLADAVRTPMVVLFSGTDLEEQWRPRAAVHRLLRRPTPCRPCYLFECPIGLPCLDITPRDVVAAAFEVLQEAGARIADRTFVGRAL